jgi:hypothetical protein
MASAKAARKKWELLKTYCAGESVSSGARRTLGTCPVFAKPVTANFTRSRRLLEAPKIKTRRLAGVSKQKCLKTPVDKAV